MQSEDTALVFILAALSRILSIGAIVLLLWDVLPAIERVATLWITTP